MQCKGHGYNGTRSAVQLLIQLLIPLYVLVLVRYNCTTYHLIIEHKKQFITITNQLLAY